ncbi:MAG: PqqD family protein [Phycisphaerales bacterium]|nr:MAG: PqqD family protein [Phycisphaerales bacterium]
MPHDKPLRRADLFLEELDGEAVLYDPRCGAVHRFNALTLFVWDACDGSHSAADIAKAVTATYTVDADEALGHVNHVVAELCTRDLLANGCAAAAKVPAVRDVDTGARAVADLAPTAEPGGQTGSMSGSMRRNPSVRRLLSRRAVLRGGATKLAFAAPAISTFFARPACASNPINPAASVFGAGGCKNPGYSCTGAFECCGGAAGAQCQWPEQVCCIKSGKTTCYRDEDCCNFPADICNAGKCE